MAGEGLQNSFLHLGSSNGTSHCNRFISWLTYVLVLSLGKLRSWWGGWWKWGFKWSPPGFCYSGVTCCCQLSPLMHLVLITQRNLIFCFCSWQEMYCSGECHSPQAQVMCMLFLPFFFFSTTFRGTLSHFLWIWLFLLQLHGSSDIMTQLMWFQMSAGIFSYCFACPAESKTELPGCVKS